MTTFPTSFPIPNFPSRAGVPVLGWGIIGPGSIAEQFAQTFLKNTDQRIVAVASRSKERADIFARTFGIDQTYGSYEALVADPKVDVVYIATTQNSHYDIAVMALNAGKHILIEKPFTTTAADAQAIADLSRSRGLFAMEAMWTRYLPQSYVVRELIKDGTFGEIVLVTADHGQAIAPGTRLSDPVRGGGALMDLGIYPIAFAFDILGKPDKVTTRGTLGETGVDAQATLTFDYSSKAQASLTTTMKAKTAMTAVIAGSHATLEYSFPFFMPTSFTLSDTEFAGESMRWSDTSGAIAHEGLSFQVNALAHYVGEGRLESPIHDLTETIAILDVLDSSRHEIGYWLPGEERP